MKGRRMTVNFSELLGRVKSAGARALSDESGSAAVTTGHFR